MDTALPQKFPFIFYMNLAKANCSENQVCTSCDTAVLGICIMLLGRCNFNSCLSPLFRLDQNFDCKIMIEKISGVPRAEQHPDHLHRVVPQPRLGGRRDVPGGGPAVAPAGPDNALQPHLPLLMGRRGVQGRPSYSNHRRYREVHPTLAIDGLI